MRKPLLLCSLLTLSWAESVTAAPATETTVREAAEQHYAVTLLTSFEPIPDSALLRGTPEQVYRTQSDVFGRTLYFVRAGFYTSAEQAEAAKQRLLKQFPAAQVTAITNEEYLKATGNKPAVAPAAPPALPPAQATSTKPAPINGTVPPERDASKLLEQARDALTRGDNTAALQILGNLLRLPPNTSSQDAQELIGLAQERLGNISSARKEYSLYLKLYPEGVGADRVRQRLAAMDTPAAQAKLKTPARKETGGSLNGSFSQHYYNGQSQTDSTTTVLGPATTTSLTSADQSALINNLDIRARYRSGDWDNRLVIRDSYTASFLDNVDSTNRLYSAYLETADRTGGFSARLGRQPGTSGGVLGRFDGATLGYNLLPKWRMNLVAGTPVDFYPVPYSKQFWGASFDLGLFAEHWNGSLYYIQQTVDDIADRQAAGGDLRFFSPTGSALLYVDYDTLFGQLNIATFQGNWQSSPATTWNTLIDRRMAPTLMTSNALFTAPSGSTIPSLLATMTEEQLHQQAVDNTPSFDTAMLGVAHNLSTTWQIGADVKRYELSAPPTSPSVTTILGTGATMMYTTQAIANGLFRQRDLTVLSVSHLDGIAYKGELLSLSQRMLFQDRWTVDLGLSYYMQQGVPVQTVIDPGTGPETHSIQTDNTRLAPMLRIGYRWGKSVTFETEYTVDLGTTTVTDQNITTGTTATTDQTVRRSYFMLGYRWDF